MSHGQKHLVKCRCVLQQFKQLKEPPVHQFVVFSVVQDDGTVIVKHAQCNNCGVVHRVTDLCKSEILGGKENSKSMITIEDIKPSLHLNYANILESNSADLATWEAVQYAVENKRWGDAVVLTTELDGNEINGKYLRVIGESLCKVESFTRSAGVIS